MSKSKSPSRAKSKTISKKKTVVSRFQPAAGKAITAKPTVDEKPEAASS